MAATSRPMQITNGFSHLFFTDIDGTLVRGAAAIPPSVKKAAAKFQTAGGGIVLATGRAAVSTRPIARELALALPCILLTGSLTFDFRRNETVDSLPLPETALALAEEILALYPAFALMAYGRERIYLLRSNAHLMRRGVRAEIPADSAVPADIKEELGKLVLVSEDSEALRECGEKLCAGSEFHFAFASRHFAEIVRAGADKGSAAQRLATRLGVRMANTFAAGDAMTDYPLLAACGHGFATADAPAELRALAEKVIPVCEEGGLAQAFEQAADIITRSGTGVSPSAP